MRKGKNEVYTENLTHQVVGRHGNRIFGRKEGYYRAQFIAAEKDETLHLSKTIPKN
jgi:phage-related protein